MTRRAAALLLAAGMCTAVASEQAPDLPTTPAAARAFDFCGYELDSAAREATLDRLDAIVDNEGRGHPGDRVATALLTAAGLRIAADDPERCPGILEEGRSRHEAADDQARRLLRNRNRFDRKRDRDIRAVQQALAELWLADQRARQTWVALRTESRTGPAFWAERLATAEVALIDARAAGFMHDLLEDWDWIDRERFGSKVSQYAWLLVQHADNHPDLQALALKRTEPYLQQNGIRKADYAHLWDRVAINAGREQRYGTQPIWECSDDGGLELEPVEDPEQLDQRRAALDMKPHRLDLDHMAGGFCGRRPSG